MVEAAASRIETARELTPEVVLALHEAGLFRALLPRSLAGYEVSPVVFVKAIEELAKADASTAWCVAQMAAASTISASLDHAVAREIFSADPRSLMAVGPPSASGRAVAAPDGYKVTGTWQFASGSRHANWIAAHCPIFEADGTPRLEPGGLPVQRTLIFPKGSVTMSDVWHVMGLKGTGSDTYAVTDLFVPAERTTAAFGRDPAEKRERGPLYQFTTVQLHGSISGASSARTRPSARTSTRCTRSASAACVSTAPHRTPKTIAAQSPDPGNGSTEPTPLPPPCALMGRGWP
jgi:alkylation response protein AidB-like acyl-CoA dehydrogenase